MKLTNYALNNLPSSSDRNTGGVYYIKTPRGFIINTVINNASKEKVLLELEPVPAMVVTNNHTVDIKDSLLFICNSTSDITISFVLSSIRKDEIYKVVNKSGTGKITFYDSDLDITFGIAGYGITYEIIYNSETGQWIKLGEYTNG